MKAKFHGIISVIACSAAMVAVGGYVGSSAWKRFDPPLRFSPSTVLGVKVPSGHQLDRMRMLSRQLDGLARPTQRPQASAPLALFGYRPQDPSNRDGSGAVQTGFQSAQRRLSLTVAAGLQRFCVIDGAFLAEGDRLADGSQVSKIEHDRVLLTFNLEQRWIYLDPTEGPSSTAMNKDPAATRVKG